MQKLLVIVIALGIFLPTTLFAQELIQDKVEIVKAQVVEVVSQEKKEVPGTDVQSVYQTLKIEILEGEKEGEIITMENDFLVLEKGDRFFLRITIDGMSGKETYFVSDLDRRGVILGFIALFIAIVIIFSGKQGLRSILSLAGSFFVILYVLVPTLLKGYPPVPTSIAIAAIILFLAIFLTHGFNRESTVAFLGTVSAVILTGILAYLGVTLAHLTGFASDEAVYLNFNTRGTLDFAG